MWIQGMVRTILRHSVSPSMKGILMSVIRMSGLMSCSMDSAISPSGASPASRNPLSSQGKLLRCPPG